MFKVIICGSRSFNSLPYLTEKCDYLLSRKSDIEIVSVMSREQIIWVLFMEIIMIIN